MFLHDRRQFIAALADGKRGSKRCDGPTTARIQAWSAPEASRA
jgi:hypothetical protein